jgi:hypothetical protein
MKSTEATLACLLFLTLGSVLPSLGQEPMKLETTTPLPVGHYTVSFSEACYQEKKMEWFLKWMTLDTGHVQGSLGIEGRYKFNVFTGQPPYNFSMEFTQMAIDDPNLINMPAGKLGDTLANTTLKTLKGEVDRDGALSLVSSQYSVDSLAGKPFYVLAFVVKKKVPLLSLPQAGETLALVNWRYFYIPDPAENKYIIIANYSENLSRTLYSSNYTPRFYECFKKVLGSLSYKD